MKNASPPFCRDAKVHCLCDSTVEVVVRLSRVPQWPVSRKGFDLLEFNVALVIDAIPSRGCREYIAWSSGEIVGCCASSTKSVFAPSTPFIETREGRECCCEDDKRYFRASVDSQNVQQGRATGTLTPNSRRGTGYKLHLENGRRRT